MTAKSNVIGVPRFTETTDLTIPTLTILDADGKLRKNAHEPAIDKATALKIYENMAYIRVLDERMVAAQRQGRLSFYLTCTGEEASVVGSIAGFKSHDMVMSQ